MRDGFIERWRELDRADPPRPLDEEELLTVRALMGTIGGEGG